MSNGGFPGSSVVKNKPDKQEMQFRSRVGKIPWRRKWQPTPIFLLRKSHGQRSLVDYSSRGRKEPDTTEQLNNNNKSLFVGLLAHTNPRMF